MLIGAFVGGSDPTLDLNFEVAEIDNTCGYADLCSDGYAALFAKMLKSSASVYEAAKKTFIENRGKEFKAILDDMGASNNIVDIRKKYESLYQATFKIV